MNARQMPISCLFSGINLEFPSEKSVAVNCRIMRGSA
jgi:hypothetical protein